MPVYTRTAAAASAALVLALAVPVSASAAPSPYTPLNPDTWAVTIHPGTIVTHNVPGNTFDGSSPLGLTVTGVSPAPTLATFSASRLTGSMVSNGGGGALIKLDFGLTTRGVYDVTLVEQGTHNTSTGVVTVITDNTAVSRSAGTAVGSLAHTGTTIDYRVLWGAAVALGLGAVMWAFTAFRNRRRRRVH